jgi:tRNA U34 2-thiouridine synthase MnmA/TrmU
VRGTLHVPVTDVEAKLRYRSPALPARVTETADGFTLELAQPAYGVAPGQIAALYAEGAVVGCGVVSAATRV